MSKIVEVVKALSLYNEEQEMKPDRSVLLKSQLLKKDRVPEVHVQGRW